jgi:hypothetical protein
MHNKPLEFLRKRFQVILVADIFIAGIEPVQGGGSRKPANRMTSKINNRFTFLPQSTGLGLTSPTVKISPFYGILALR